MLESFYIEAFRFIPKEIATMILAALPVSELRGSIPFAMGVYKFSALKAFLYAVLGNMIPPMLILLYIDPVAKFLRVRSKKADRFFEWLFTRTRKKFQKNYERWEVLGLAIFVAIPLPMTGAWTGALGAYLFNIPPKKAYPAIVLGVLIAGGIITAVSAGAFHIF